MMVAAADTVLDRPITTRTIIAKGVDRAANVCQSSSKTGGSDFSGITWSTPIGLVHEFSDLFFARASDKSIVCLWAKHDIPIGYLMLGDKGFDKNSGCYYNNNNNNNDNTF